MKKGFNLPIVMDVPLETAADIQNKVDADTLYLRARNQKTKDKYDKVNSKLRIIADYITDFFRSNPTGELSHSKIAHDLGFNEGTVWQAVSELMCWENYLLDLVPSKKPGFFQLSSKDINDTEKWIRRQSRTIATKQQRLDKVERSVVIKRKIRDKVKVKAQSQSA